MLDCQPAFRKAQSYPSITSHKRKVMLKCNQTKNFHVDIDGYPCKHAVSTELIAVIALANLWLYERRYSGEHRVTVQEVDPQILNRRGREHLAELLEEDTAGFAYYDENDGWTLYSVSDDLNS